MEKALIKCVLIFEYETKSLSFVQVTEEDKVLGFTFKDLVEKKMWMHPSVTYSYLYNWLKIISRLF